MSKEAALAFRDQVVRTPQLQDQIRQMIEQGQSLEQAVRLGKENGFTFSTEEAEQALQEAAQGELSDFELALVAGGASKGGGSKPWVSKFSKGGGVLPQGGSNVLPQGGSNLISDKGNGFRKW